MLGAPPPQALAGGTGTRALNSSKPPVDADEVCSRNAWQLELEFGQNEFSIEVLAPALAAAQVSVAACGDVLVTSILDNMAHTSGTKRAPE